MIPDGMRAALPTRDAGLPAAYSQALDALALGPLWTALHMLLPSERGSRAVPHRWRWHDARPLLLEAARLVPIEQAERRVLVLENPGLRGAYSITATLFAGLQIILPGEAAPSHHHTPAALRLVVEGRGAFTTVDGVKCAMEPGDLIVTPPMRWHDHGHEGHEPFTAAGLVPRRSRYPDTGYPQVRWPWASVRGALAAMAAAAPADQPVALRYVNPKTGAPPLPTLGCEALWLRPGEVTRAPRSSVSAVCHVIEGRGETRVGDAALTWEAGDTLVVPPWNRVEHRNASASVPACLFQFNDEPALRALGLWHEEADP